MVGYVIHYKKKKNNNNSSSSDSGSDGTDIGGGVVVMVKGKGKGEDGGKKKMEMRQRGRRRGRAAEWAERLVRERYFGECAAHGGQRKGEENMFCVDCRRRMCFHCLDDGRQQQGHQQGRHRGHCLLQIRKYVYRDVVRVVDLQKLLDLSSIQPYTVNGAKVVHLNPRDKSTPSKLNSGGPACQICHQSVCSDLSRYCSVACKLSEEASSEEEKESGPSDDNAAERSELSIHDPTSELDENGTDKELDSSLVHSQNQQQQQQRLREQQQPYDPGEENQGSRKQRRKGVPRRAPEF